MSPVEMGRLIADISKRGLLFPVTVQGDTLLDGRNRLQACETAGVPLRTTEYQGDDAAAFIHSTNERRDLTISQRAMVAAKIANIANGQVGRNHDRVQVGETADLKTQAEAAATMNVPERTVRAAKRVLDADPVLAEKVALGKTRIYAAEAAVRGKARNVARAEAVAPAKPVRAPVAERVKQITELLAEGNNLEQVSAAVNMSTQYVGDFINKHHIQASDYSVGRRRGTPTKSAASIIEETVNALAGLSHGVQLAKSRKLEMPQEQAIALLREARDSLKAINWIVGALREIANG